jgi:hypothetical protein
MAIYFCLVCLALALVTLVWGNSRQRQRAAHFGAGIVFVALAAIVMIVSVIHSLWFYPL